MPQTNTTGSTHWRASCALITWTTLRRPSSRRSGLRRRTLLTARQKSSMGRSAGAAEGLGGLAERFVEEAQRQRPGCDTGARVRGWRDPAGARGGRDRAGCRSAPPSPWARVEGTPFFQRGERIELMQERSAKGGLACPRRASSERVRRGRIGDLFAHGEIEAVHGAEIGEAGREAKDAEGGGVVPSAEHGIDGAGQKADDRVALQVAHRNRSGRECRSARGWSGGWERRFPGRGR